MTFIALWLKKISSTKPAHFAPVIFARELAVLRAAGKAKKAHSGRKQVQAVLRAAPNGATIPVARRAMQAAGSLGVQNPGMHDR